MEALEKLENILSEYGLSEEDINYLLAQFLEEEAEFYVECMNLLEENTSDYVS